MVPHDSSKLGWAPSQGPLIWGCGHSVGATQCYPCPKPYFQASRSSSWWVWDLSRKGREPQAFTHSLHLHPLPWVHEGPRCSWCLPRGAPRPRKNLLQEQVTEDIQSHSSMVTGSLNPPEKLLSGTRVSEKGPPCPAPGGHDTMWTMCYQRAGV